MNRVGIIVAMQAEARCITAQRLPFDQSLPLRENLFIRISGMGGAAAQRAAAALHGEQHMDGLISFGVAGALQEDLQSGDLVLPDSIVGDRIYPTDVDWRMRVEQCLPAGAGIRVVNRAVAHSRQVQSTAAGKRALAAATHACAVDMESSAIAAVAADAGIPFIAVRAITDPVQISPPAALMGALQPDGSVHFARLMALLLKRSVGLSELLRLAPGMRAACATLKSVIRHAETELGRPPRPAA
ncbi:MAG: purine phosphorylase [Nitrosomonas halophila]